METQKNIGQIPEKVQINTTSATLPEIRNTLSKVEVRKHTKKLNSIDSSLLSMPIEIFETLIENMSSKDISGLSLDTNL